MNLEKLVPKLLAGIVEERRLRSVAERRAKDKLIRGATNFKMLILRLHEMGIDTETPTGKAVLGKILRIAAIQKELALEGDDMPPSTLGGNEW